MIRSIAKSGVYSVGAALVGYLVTVLVARNFAENDVARYLYWVAVGALLVQFLDVASDQCAVHFARFRNKSIESVWRLLAGFKIRLLLVAMVLVIFYEWLASVELPKLALLLLVPAFYLGPVYEYRGENLNYAKVLFAERTTLLAAACLFVFVGVAIEWVVLSVFFISACSVVFQYRRCFVGTVENDDRNSGELARYVTSYGPVYLVLASQLAYGNISRLIIDSKLGAIAFASLTLALQVVNSASMIQGQIDRHVRPEIVKSVVEGNHNEALRIIKNYIVWYVVPLAVGSVFLGIFAQEIVNVLYGPRWDAAADALLYSSPLLISVAGMRLIDIIAVALNVSRVNMLVNFMAGLGLLTILWLGPLGTLVGYVSAIVAVQFLQVGVMTVYVYRRFK
jgi:O-antigen/teichoic acid export membrane protein